jgi:hypothetical protein
MPENSLRIASEGLLYSSYRFRKKYGETAKKTGQEFYVGDLIRKICHAYKTTLWKKISDLVSSFLVHALVQTATSA